jgi:hypothetical protein
MFPKLRSAPEITLWGRAYWTGKSEHILSVTSRAAIRCQYNAAGTIFWRTFLGTSCPGKIEVE